MENIKISKQKRKDNNKCKVKCFKTLNEEVQAYYKL